MTAPGPSDPRAALASALSEARPGRRRRGRRPDAILRLVETEPACFSRHTFTPGHVTGSAFVVCPRDGPRPPPPPPASRRLAADRRPRRGRVRPPGDRAPRGGGGIGAARPRAPVGRDPRRRRPPDPRRQGRASPPPPRRALRACDRDARGHPPRRRRVRRPPLVHAGRGRGEDERARRPSRPRPDRGAPRGAARKVRRRPGRLRARRRRLPRSGTSPR